MKTLFGILIFALTLIFGLMWILTYFLVFTPLWFITYSIAGLNETADEWYTKTKQLFMIEWV